MSNTQNSYSSGAQYAVGPTTPTFDSPLASPLDSPTDDSPAHPSPESFSLSSVKEWGAGPRLKDYSEKRKAVFSAWEYPDTALFGKYDKYGPASLKSPEAKTKIDRIGECISESYRLNQQALEHSEIQNEEISKASKQLALAYERQFFSAIDVDTPSLVLSISDVGKLDERDSMGNTLLGLARHFGQQKMEDKLLELGATVYVCDLPPIIPLRPSSAESFRSEASSVSMSSGSSEMKGDSPQGEASSLHVPLRKSEQRALCFRAGLEKLSKKLMRVLQVMFRG